MSKDKTKPVRRLKKSLPENARLKVKIASLERRVRELQEKHEGGWVSPDGEYCDTRYAARYLGKSESRLRNMKSERTGPISFSKSGAVYYRLDDLRAWIEEGRSVRDLETEKNRSL